MLYFSETSWIGANEPNRPLTAPATAGSTSRTSSGSSTPSERFFRSQAVFIRFSDRMGAGMVIAPSLRWTRSTGPSRAATEPEVDVLPRTRHLTRSRRFQEKRRKYDDLPRFCSETPPGPRFTTTRSSRHPARSSRPLRASPAPPVRRGPAARSRAGSRVPPAGPGGDRPRRRAGRASPRDRTRR